MISGVGTLPSISSGAGAMMTSTLPILPYEGVFLFDMQDHESAVTNIFITATECIRLRSRLSRTTLRFVHSSSQMNSPGIASTTSCRKSRDHTSPRTSQSTNQRSLTHLSNVMHSGIMIQLRTIPRASARLVRLSMNVSLARYKYPSKRPHLTVVLEETNIGVLDFVYGA